MNGIRDFIRLQAFVHEKVSQQNTCCIILGLSVPQLCAQTGYFFFNFVQR